MPCRSRLPQRGSRRLLLVYSILVDESPLHIILSFWRPVLQYVYPLVPLVYCAG